MSDLTDAEFAELDELLAAAPQPVQALDVVSLDGYLCGVLVQPERLDAARWLLPVFEYDGQEMPAGVLETVDPVWRERLFALIERRHAALRRAIVEDGWFHPFVLEVSDPADGPDVPGGEDAAEPEAGPGSGSEPSSVSDEDWASLPEHSRPLFAWVAGFELAMQSFPLLASSAEDATLNTLARLYRHLPAQTDDERELVATLDRSLPLRSLDDAIEDLVTAVVELSDLTERERYRVEQVRRSAPKVGRNDPCPCGSGRKFKLCHGAT